MNNLTYDICIVGGGINGAGIALDAASRGLKVLLCEQNDLASATSSWSSKLIHGGLRYLEYREFRLVREALQEREILLKLAPHLIEELRFILPHEKHHRPLWLIRLGLFLYDYLAKRKTIRRSHAISLKNLSYYNVLQSYLQMAFIYSDCRVDDARLVVAVALKAEELGASILTRHRCINAKSVNDLWHIDIQNTNNQEITQVQANVLINATGPWANQFLTENLHLPTHYKMKLVQGSHIIVPKIYLGTEAFILQNTDNRIIFVIPYQNDFSLIGTTEVDFHGDLSSPTIQENEIQYLVDSVKKYFKTNLTKKDIIWHYTGVRPLIDGHENNPSAISRDYLIELSKDSHLPLLNVYSGKITTYRKLALHAVNKLAPFFPELSKSKTKKLILSGGNFPGTKQNYLNDMQQAYPWLDHTLLHRYINCYGTRITILLSNCHQLSDLGEHFGAGLYEREIIYLMQHEWAQTVEDVIWRRTKLGLYLDKEQIAKIEAFISSQD